MNNVQLMATEWDKQFKTIPTDLTHPDDYPRLARTLIGVSECQPWEVVGADGLSRPEYCFLKRRSSVFRKLAQEAEAVADDVRQGVREEAAHSRAVDGERTPTVNMRGEIVDWYPKRSDKLLTFLMESSNPDKYRNKTTSLGGGVVLNVNFGIPSRVPVKVIDVTPVNEPAKLKEGEVEP